MRKIKQWIVCVILSPILLMLIIWEFIAGPPANKAGLRKRIRAILIPIFALIFALLTTATVLMPVFQDAIASLNRYMVAAAITIGMLIGFLSIEILIMALKRRRLILTHLYRYLLVIFIAAALAFGISIAGKLAWAVAVLAFVAGTIAFLLAGESEN